MSSAENQPDPELPRQYGRYELLERIGEGGMAEVFRARLPGVAGFEKILVIKRILPHLARNKRFVKMFVNEAQLAAKLQHQNVVQVYELGQAESGELYIAMEYVRGIDLRGILRNAAQRVLRIPIWFTMHTIAEVLSGLSHAHELADDEGNPLEVVHRDVTPSNVFVSEKGGIKLADFGIAKAAGQVSETRHGQLKGKISYMPPEQLHGQPLDARADVFAAGVVMWECLTQRRLFGGRPDFETMLAICESKREPPSRYNPKIPPDLDAVTLRALEPDREHRYESAAAFQAAILEARSQIRPRLLPAEIRHVVEVLLGKKDPDPELGADLPYEGPAPIPRAPSSKELEPAAQMPLAPIHPDPLAAVQALTPNWNPSIPWSGTQPPAPLPSGWTPPLPGTPGPSFPAPGPFPNQFTPSMYPPSAGQGMVTPPVPNYSDRPPTPSIPRPTAIPQPGLQPPIPIPEASAIPQPGLQTPLPIPEASATPHPGLQAPLPIPEASAVPQPGVQTSLPAPEPTPEFPFPFFVKTRKHGALGPLSYDQMLDACNPKTYGGLEISSNGERWMPVPTFATLAGLEYLAPQKVAFTNVVMVQRLEERSLVHILARLGLTRKTGRLILMESGSGLDVARREIDLLQGAPTFVYTDRPELQLPELLARRELVADEQLPSLLHEVLQSERALLDIVAARTSQDVRRQLTFLMRDRMAELFTWRVGKVAFDEGTQPRSNQPFAPSTLRVLFGCVQRSWSSGELEAVLQPHLEVPLQVSDRFEELVLELGLDPSQEAAARRFTSGGTIASVLQDNASEVMTHLLIAYLLLEMKLIFHPSE